MFGERLQILREQREITQIALARELHIGQATYNRYEHNLREPDLATLKRIAEYFHVSIDYLLGYTVHGDGSPHIPELHDFLLNSDYLIDARKPTIKERKLLARILKAVSEIEKD